MQKSVLTFSWRNLSKMMIFSLQGQLKYHRLNNSSSSKLSSQITSMHSLGANFRIINLLSPCSCYLIRKEESISAFLLYQINKKGKQNYRANQNVYFHDHNLMYPSAPAENSQGWNGCQMTFMTPKSSYFVCPRSCLTGTISGFCR